MTDLGTQSCFGPLALAQSQNMLHLASNWHCFFDFGCKSDGMVCFGQKAWQVSLAQPLAPSMSILLANCVGWLNRGEGTDRSNARHCQQILHIILWLARPGLGSLSQAAMNRSKRMPLTSKRKAAHGTHEGQSQHCSQIRIAWSCRPGW